MCDEERLREAREYWDREAATVDEQPDHGLNDPVVLRAWTARLSQWLPQPRARVLDVGCGTGSLSVLLARLGHAVMGIDLSPAMIERARAKAAAKGLQATFRVMDASDPPLAPQRFDAIVCRHLLWALPQPAEGLRRWSGCLAPAGRLLLIEGYWATGTGLHVEEVLEALPPALTVEAVEDLTGNHDLWGADVTDERYAVIAHLPDGAE